MPAQQNSRFRGCFRKVVVLALASLALASASTTRAQAITNLHQLTQLMNSSQQTNQDVDLTVTVCAATRPKMGVLIVQDDTGVELLQVGDFGREIVPGEQIHIRRRSCLLRKREMGVEISAMPVVNNDGLHPLKVVTAEVRLPAGKIPVRVEWFNYWRSFTLEVQWAVANEQPRLIGASNLWHAVVTESGATNFLPGLRAECYEGLWETLPDFNLLQPVKTGLVTNINLNFRSRDENVDIRYTGFLDVPRAGRYRFSVSSDDGAALYLGDLSVPVVTLGRNTAPEPAPGQNLATDITNLDERCWMVAEGRVSFVSQTDEVVRFDLHIGQQVISVRLADATGLDFSNLLNARVRITGIGHGVLTSDQTLVLGKLFVASAKDLVFVEHPHRRAYYDLLADEGVGEAHLTDLYKKRGQAGELKNGLPADFQEHLQFFLKEVDLLQPTTILAMGKDAYNLLRRHTPKLSKRCFRVWHFGAVRHGNLEEFQTSLRNGIKIAKARENAGLKPG